MKSTTRSDLSAAVLFCLFVFASKYTGITTYRFMSDYEYQLGLVDSIVEAAPGDEITKEFYLDGKDYLSNLTVEQQYRMCKEAIQLERLQINNYSLIEKDVPGKVKKYKCSFQISHGPEDTMHIISFGFPCPTEPGPVYLQQGPQQEIIYVNTLKSVATTPAWEF